MLTNNEEPILSPMRSNLNEYEWNTFFEEFQNETPRAAVIVSCAFMDTLLRDLIASFMIEKDKAVDELLGSDHNPDTPLGSFGARIKTAYCLGLIGKMEYHDLNLIKKIRNRFAHRLHGYSFDDDEIVKWCNLLQHPKILGAALPKISKSHRDSYIIAVSMLSNQLGLRILGNQRDRRTVRKDVQMGPVVIVNGEDTNK